MGEAALKQPQATSEETVVYFAMDDQYEAAIAKEWVKKNAPKALLLTKLPLNKLNASVVVVPLIRRDQRSAVERALLDRDTGKQKLVKTPNHELLHEIVECPPIKVARFWTGAKDSFGALTGDVNRLQFHDAMAESVSPIKAEIPDGNPDLMVLVFS